MANAQNLKPARSSREARERGRKGGIASGKARRSRRLLSEELEALLSSKDPQTQKTKAAAIASALVDRALKGDTKAFEIIRDTIGEKPVDNIRVSNPDFSVLDSIEFTEHEGGKCYE